MNHLIWLLSLILPSTIQDGGTALGEASIGGHHKIVEVLLGAGANPNLQDKVRTGQNRIHALLLVYILSTCFACFYLKTFC